MFAKANELQYENFADLTRNSAVYDLIKTSVESANSRISSSEQIKTFAILERDFSLEADEITPTMKLKRNVVSEHFVDVLESLYS